MTDTVSASAGVSLAQIRTPAKSPGVLGSPMLMDLAARIGVKMLARPLRIGKLVIAARHRQVAEILRRDLDFRIAPVNADRIEAVSGPFVLGMDRSGQLATERRALYTAMAGVDLSALAREASDHAEALLAGASTIDAVAGYARRVAGRTAQRLFGVSGPDETIFLEVARSIFAHTFLNLGGDKSVEARAVKAGQLLSGWLSDELARRRSEGRTGDDFMGALMRDPALDDDGVRRMVAGMLVGSIDTTATAVTKIVHVLGADRGLAAAARRDLDDPVTWRAWCWEALRRWPHNPLILREAAAPTSIGGVAVAKGDRIVAWTQAAMLDPDAFPAPRQARPDRAPGAYLHFGGGLHPCGGRALNDLQIPILVGKLLARGLTHVGPIKWAGPFPDHQFVRLGDPR